MLGLTFANYLNENMERLGLTNQILERKSGVSDSTIATYRKGTSKKPAKDNMLRIAAALGDPPSVVDEMIASSSGTAADEEQRLLAEAADQARLERIVSMMREQMVQMLGDFREQSAAQQTEIIQHADKRIADAEADFKRRNEAVLEQCREEVQREKDHCQQRIDDMRQYAEHVYKTEREHRRELRVRNKSSREYLKSMVRNISVCGLLLGMIAFFSSGYALFAFFAFDLSDPTRGLYQGNAAAAIIILIIVLAVLGVIAWRLFVLYRRRIRNESQVEDDENKKLEDVEP